MRVDSTGIHDLTRGLGHVGGKVAPSGNIDQILENGFYAYQYSGGSLNNAPTGTPTYGALLNVTTWSQLRTEMFFQTQPEQEVAAFLRHTADWNDSTTNWTPWAKVQLGSALYVAAFGAVGYAVGTSPSSMSTDDTAKIQAAIDAASAGGGGTVFLDQSRKYYVNGTLTIKAGVTLAGHMARPGFRLQPPAAPSGLDLASWGSQLVLGSSGAIAMNSSTGLRNTVILYVGITSLPRQRLANSALIDGFSTSVNAVTINGDDVMVKDCFIGGFNLAVWSKHDRAVLDGVWGDNYNGILIQDALDVVRVSNCHFFPWLTIYSTEPSGTGWPDYNSLRRTGNTNYAFKITGTVDWPRMHNCFCYGYFYGFWLEGGSSILLSMCGADNTTAHAYSIGFNITGSQDEVRMDMCQSAAHQIGCYGQLGYTGGSAKKKLMVTNCDFWGHDGQGFHSGVGNNTTRLIGCNFRSGAPGSTGIYVIGSTSRVYYRDCTIHDNTTPVTGSGSYPVDLGGNLQL